MSGHTPGPWRFEAGDSVVHILAGEAQIADTSSKRYYERHDETDIANARLIAAAPALLEQAELFERCLVYEIKKSETSGDDEGARLKTVTLNMLRAAIAQAKGEKP